MSKRLVNGRLYMDALGEPGRSPGSFPIYAVCIVWVSQSEEGLETAFASVRQSLKLGNDYEFHARQLTGRDWKIEMPKRFFQLLIDEHNLTIECWCAEVQKSRSRLPIHIAGKALTYELVAQILQQMPRERIDGVPLTIDEEAKAKKAPKVVAELRSSAKRALEAQGHQYMLGKVSARPAHQKAGLQLADFLAAAIVEPWPSCAKTLAQWPIHHWHT